MLGVDAVALARQPPLALARRTVDVLDLVPAASQEPGEPDAVGAGALDAEGDEPALWSDVRDAGREQPLEGGRGSRNGDLLQLAAQAVQDDAGVFVLVRVDADDDIVAAKEHAGHGRGLLTDHGRSSAGRGRRTGLRWDLVWSGSYDVTAAPGQRPERRCDGGRQVNAKAPSGAGRNKGQTDAAATARCSQS